MKSIFNGRVASVLLVMLFVAMGSSSVFALTWEERCEDPKFEDHPECTGDPDPDPGDETMTLGSVYAWWAGDVHDQFQLPNGEFYYGRICEGSGTISNGFVGHACTREEQVHFTLTEPADESIGKEASTLCPMLTDFLIGGENPGTGFGRITAYHFTIDPTWNDSKCGGDNPSCLVRVRMTAYFDDWCDGKKCGRLVLVWGWGHALPAGGTELNPFVNDQVLNIHDLEIFFKGIGTNRDVAHCRWYNSGVQFITDNPNR
ncbi:MAG: hypothetical protein PVJ71_06615 [Lysobacterales bacterium]